MDGTDGYRYDLFVSYSRTPNASRWVGTHFVPTLRDELTEELEHVPRIFLDVQQDAGTPWPENLLYALQRSKPLVAIWSPPFFRSRWCLAEWHTFRSREQYVGVGPGGQAALVYPIRFRDGDRFPPEAGGVQQEMCFKQYCNPDPQFATSHDFEPFRKRVQGVAERLAARLEGAPEWRPDWPVVRPPLPPAVDPRCRCSGGRDDGQGRHLLLLQGWGRADLRPGEHRGRARPVGLPGALRRLGPRRSRAGALPAAVARRRTRPRGGGARRRPRGGRPARSRGGRGPRHPARRGRPARPDSRGRRGRRVRRPRAAPRLGGALRRPRPGRFPGAVPHAVGRALRPGAGGQPHRDHRHRRHLHRPAAGHPGHVLHRERAERARHPRRRPAGLGGPGPAALRPGRSADRAGAQPVRRAGGVQEGGVVAVAVRDRVRAARGAVGLARHRDLAADLPPDRSVRVVLELRGGAAGARRGRPDPGPDRLLPGDPGRPAGPPAGPHRAARRQPGLVRRRGGPRRPAARHRSRRLPERPAPGPRARRPDRPCGARPVHGGVPRRPRPRRRRDRHAGRRRGADRRRPPGGAGRAGRAGPPPGPRGGAVPAAEPRRGLGPAGDPGPHPPGERLRVAEPARAVPDRAADGRRRRERRGRRRRHRPRRLPRHRRAARGRDGACGGAGDPRRPGRLGARPAALAADRPGAGYRRAGGRRRRRPGTARGRDRPRAARPAPRRGGGPGRRRDARRPAGPRPRAARPARRPARCHDRARGRHGPARTVLRGRPRRGPRRRRPRRGGPLPAGGRGRRPRGGVPAGAGTPPAVARGWGRCQRPRRRGPALRARLPARPGPGAPGAARRRRGRGRGGGRVGAGGLVEPGRRARRARPREAARGRAAADGTALDDAVWLAELVVDLSPPQERPDALANLVLALRARFHGVGDRADLDRAVELRREWDGSAERLATALGLALVDRYGLTTRAADLDAAIELFAHAVTGSDGDDPALPGRRSNLASARATRFLARGELADLTAAIDLLRTAVATAPEDRERAGYAANLGVALSTRYGHLGEGRDLDEAVSWLRRAVDALAAGYPDRVPALSGLGLALRTRYQRDGDGADLDAAVAALEEALAATSDRPDRAGFASNLSTVLRVRADAGGDPMDADRAVALARTAVELSPPDAASRPRYLSNLGAALSARGGADDLDEAVEAGREAVAMLGPHDPLGATVGANLGLALRRRYECVGDPADLEAVLVAYRTAARVVTAAPLPRAIAAREWGDAAAEFESHEEALDGYTAALDLLGQVTDRRLAPVDQQRGLARMGGLGSAAAATALDAGDPERALALLEQGRGVLLAQALDTRGESEALHTLHPELAERFVVLARRLNDPGWPSRRRLVAEWDDLLDDIRTRRGFERFLRTPSVAELVEAAGDGPVVAVNVAATRCDALVVVDGRVLTLPLPDLTYANVHDWAAAFLAAVHGDDPDRDATVATTLDWLRAAVVTPVLDRIRGRSFDRIWWMPTGPLAVLPLGAAADQTVPSTIPSLRALGHARGQASKGRGGTVVVAAAGTAADLPALPAAGAEADEVAAGRPGDVLVLTGDQATVDAVRHALPRYADGHFACHAVVDPADPSRSGLVLADGTLTVREIQALENQGAGLAFLSACSTAFGGATLLDEAVHVAAAFQVAGYRHVIATMWPVGDLAARRFARLVYAALDGGAGPAEAVRRAVDRTREALPGRPSVWAAAVHFGP